MGSISQADTQSLDYACSTDNIILVWGSLVLIVILMEAFDMSYEVQ
jgi:hypothetical protein